MINIAQKVLESDLCLPAQKVESIMRSVLAHLVYQDMLKERSNMEKHYYQQKPTRRRHRGRPKKYDKR